MKPRATANRVLSTTRARAKMHEFRVAPEHFIELYRDPAMLFDLAVGILGDVAAVTADRFCGVEALEGLDWNVAPASWETEELSVSEGLRFASGFFDAYLNAKLDGTISTEFSLLCAAAYYLNGSVGNAAVIVKNVEAPPLGLADGLARLIYQILRNDFSPVDAVRDGVNTVLGSMTGFVTFASDVTAVSASCEALRDAAQMRCVL